MFYSPTKEGNAQMLKDFNSGELGLKERDPNCDRCEGTGVMYVQNGPDDYNSEVCFCNEKVYGRPTE